MKGINRALCCVILMNGLILAHNSFADNHSENSGRVLSEKECVRYAVNNSFEVRLAKLDFLIKETDRGITDAIFDTVLTGEASLEEDRLKGVSVFSGELSRTNTYEFGINKKLKTGTEVDMSLSETRSWGDSGFERENPAHTSKLTVELNQPIAKNIFGYVDRRNVTITRLAIQNADLDTKDRIENLIVDVEKAYWEWMFYKTNLDTFREILSKANELEERNRNNYDIGRIERGDLLASQANVEIRKKDVRIAENEYRLAEEKIKLLMNMSAETRIDPGDDLLYNRRDFTIEGCFKKAFEMRRDYKSAKRDLEIKDLTLQTKANERWPEIDLVGSFAANGIDSTVEESFTKMMTKNNTEYYAGIEISMPIENNDAKSEFRKSEHDKEKAIITVKDTERIIVTDVGNAYRNYRTYNDVLGNLMEASTLQKEKLVEEEKRFNTGRSNTKTIIDYQQDEVRARREVALGIVNLEKARIDLEDTLDTILEKYKGIL